LGDPLKGNLLLFYKPLHLEAQQVSTRIEVRRHQNASQLGAQGGQKTRHACGLALDKGPVIPGHLVFGLLFQNKSVPAQAVTDESATDEALEFWQQEEDEFVTKMQASDNMREDDVELSLPEDIMPSLDQMLQQKADLDKTFQGVPKSRKSGAQSRL
jgi:hypothetical protein